MTRDDIRWRLILRWLADDDNSWSTFADVVIVIACGMLILAYAFGWPN